MKKILLNIIGLLLLCSVWNACSKDFVETEPIAQSTEVTFYKTMAGVESGVTACYSVLTAIKTFDLDILMTMGSIASDEAEAGAAGKTDVIEYQHVDQLAYTSAEANVLDRPYGFIYRGIMYCNTVLTKIPEFQRSDDPDNYDSLLLQKRYGEASFMRAFYYFTLTQIYGGVPLIDHLLTGSEYNQSRAEISDLYDFIKSDLHVAIANLPTHTEWGADNIGRASKGAAEALLAKVFLYESSYAKYCTDDGTYNGLGVSRFQGMSEHWDSAAYWAEQVIASDNYGLIGENGERFNTWRDPDPAIANTGGYQYIFMLAADNSKEGVFEIQSATDGEEWFDTKGEAYIRWCAPRVLNIGGTTQDYGWGWWCPTDFLVNQYETGDPRYKATVMEEGDTLLHTTGWVTANFDALRDGTGLHRATRKYECSPAEFWSLGLGWEEGPINIKLIRYADVLLFASEAYFEMDNTEKALEYINLVRKRARMSGPDGDAGNPKELTAITHDDIVHERLVELALEGHRFWDLVRWNLAKTYLDHTLADGTAVTFIKGTHEFYPIPDEEISQSKGTIKQYPGWE